MSVGVMKDQTLKLRDLRDSHTIHWVARGTEHLKIRDEVNKREIYECDG